MTPLRREENNYYITNAKSYKKVRAFKSSTVKKVFDFAYAMTFGEDGEHRNHRSGGNYRRKKGEIFINAFQGKLSELAIHIQFSLFNREVQKRLPDPDFAVYGLGEWDDCDMQLDTKTFSIKSTKFYGNLLLLETKDWDQNGCYIPNLNNEHTSTYDYFVLIRIKPDGEKVMKENKILYANEIKRDTLQNIILNQNWEYDIPGYITSEDYINVIKRAQILPQGSMLNARTKMDAENYYVQSGDLRDFNPLIKSF